MRYTVLLYHLWGTLPLNGLNSVSCVYIAAFLDTGLCFIFQYKYCNTSAFHQQRITGLICIVLYCIV